jgi:hypothetical protein
LLGSLSSYFLKYILKGSGRGMMTSSFRRDWDDAHQPLQQALKTALGGHL